MPFYRRDRDLVRIVRVKAKASDGAVVTMPAVDRVPAAALGRALGQAARWERFDRHGNLIAIDPPKEVIEQIITMVDEWPFPPLLGVISTPILRPDGSLLLTEGYVSCNRVHAVRTAADAADFRIGRPCGMHSIAWRW